jgi:phosphoserine phosphatase
MIYTPALPLEFPVTGIVFDCDGTLSSIEGIDALARHRGVTAEVSALTAEAMNQSGVNPELYAKRLHMVMPTEEQVEALGSEYIQHQVPDLQEVIAAFKRLNKSIYIVSAGLSPAVRIFAKHLGIAQEQVFAVDVYFNEQGHYQDFDHNSPLIHADGKCRVVSALQKIHPRLIHVGDGANDYVTRHMVTRFIGYGGVFYRKSLAEQCDYYIESLSMSPLLALALTEQELKSL